MNLINKKWLKESTKEIWKKITLQKSMEIDGELFKISSKLKLRFEQCLDEYINSLVDQFNWWWNR